MRREMITPLQCKLKPVTVMSFICFNAVYEEELLQVHTSPRVCAWGVKQMSCLAYWGELKSKQACRRVEHTHTHHLADRMTRGASLVCFSLIKEVTCWLCMMSCHRSSCISYLYSPVCCILMLCVCCMHKQKFRLPVHLSCIFSKGFSSSEPASLCFLLPLLGALASGRKCVAARSSWTILRNVSHRNIRTHTQDPEGMSAKGKSGDRREQERKWGRRERP